MPYNFPYTNFHELNLDWIMKRLQETNPISIVWEGVNEVIEDPDNPGSYLLQTSFPDAYNHLEAYKKGCILLLHCPAHTAREEAFGYIEALIITSPIGCYAFGSATLTYDDQTDNLLFITNI